MSKLPDTGPRDAGYKRILIVRLDRIGDVLLSTPVIKAVRDAYPSCYIAFMVSPYARDIVEGNPYLNEVIVYDKAGVHSGLAGNARFIRELKDRNFDLAIALHPTVRTHAVLRLSGIPERVGYDRKAGFFLTKRAPHTKQFGMKHEIDYALDILRYAGIEAKDRQLYMPVNSASEKKIADILIKSCIGSSDRLVAFNPGSSCASKRWRIESFAEVANILSRRLGIKSVVISGASDKSYGDRLASMIEGPVINLSGKTGVADIASVLRRCRLFISNDSGPVHIGCAVGTPVIVIFGRNDRGLSPKRWGPSGPDAVVLHKGAGCDICYAHNCRIGFKCLDSIRPEEVVAAAEKMLGDTGS